MTVGERIKQRRKELGYNADRLAKLLGVSRSTIYRYENGEIEKMPTDILEPLAHALHTTPAYLMGWSDSNELHSAHYGVYTKVPAKSKVDAVRKIMQMQLEQAGLLDNGATITEEQAMNIYNACHFEPPHKEEQSALEDQLFSAYEEVRQELDKDDIADIEMFIHAIADRARKKRGSGAYDK